MSTDRHDDIATLLREVPVPPSRITTDQALSLGRKAMRRRRHGITAGAAVAVVAATAGGLTLAYPAPHPSPLSLGSPSPSATPVPSPSPSRAPSGWAATALPLPDKNGAIVSAMDSSGRYIAGTGMGFKAVLWDNLTPQFLPPPADTLDDLQVVGVNSAGVVIGDAASNDGPGFVWVYRDGATTKLPAPKAGGRYHARDINDRGDILGWSERSGPILWPAGSRTTPRVLSNVDDAFSLGDDGSIGGTTNDGDHPVLLSPGGQPRRLAELPSRPGGKVFAISGDFACGWVPADTDSNLMSARWDLRTGELTPLPSVASSPMAISATGVMISSLKTFSPKVLVMPDGTIVELPPPADAPPETAPAPARGADVDAIDITADGTAVAGNYRLMSGASTPILWRKLKA